MPGTITSTDSAWVDVIQGKPFLLGYPGAYSCNKVWSGNLESICIPGSGRTAVEFHPYLRREAARRGDGEWLEAFDIL
jgi:hypothetical protein